MKMDPLRNIGRVFVCLCVSFLNEWVLFAIIAASGIGNGRGAEGLAAALFWFFVFSIPVISITCYYTWRFTKK